jgi:dipeptidyl-peptidase-4
MRKPQDNPSGYDNNSPINHVDKLKGKFLMIHGSTDDNVHLQNSMDMITALVKADKQFEFMVYPNKNHGIFGGNTRYHLFYKINDFLFDNLLESE